MAWQQHLQPLPDKLQVLNEVPAEEIIAKEKKIWKIEQFDYNHDAGDCPFLGSGDW